MAQEEITCGKCSKTKDICNCGRPSLYKNEFIEKAQDYLKANKDEDRKDSDGRVVGKKVNLPTIEGYATFIGVCKDTLYEWAKTRPEFSDVLAKIKQEQQDRLINNGLSGDYNPTIAKLILSSNHGMSEKTIQENQGEMNVNHVVTGIEIK